MCLFNVRVALTIALTVHERPAWTKAFYRATFQPNQLHTGWNECHGILGTNVAQIDNYKSFSAVFHNHTWNTEILFAMLWLTYFFHVRLFIYLFCIHYAQRTISLFRCISRIQYTYLDLSLLLLTAGNMPVASARPCVFVCIRAPATERSEANINQPKPHTYSKKWNVHT